MCTSTGPAIPDLRRVFTYLQRVGEQSDLKFPFSFATHELNLGRYYLRMNRGQGGGRIKSTFF